jgi:hypothetical protein
MDAISLPADVGAPEAHGLMLGHRAEAQRIVDASLAGGLSPLESVAKARRAIRAGQRARVQYLAELEVQPTLH